MTSAPFDPLDPAQTSPGYYMTRWITHLCAPVFIFLAGTSAFLYGHRGRSRGEVSQFLISRGVWLVLLNFTVVWFLGWSWAFHLGFIEAGVIYAIGVCMIVLAAAIWLPRWAIGLIAFTQVFGHNLLDGIRPEQFGGAAWVWTLLHVKGGFDLGATRIDVYYPLIPWMGVMMLGYLFAPALLAPPDVRRRRIFSIGSAAVILFFVLRFANLYGDLHRWAPEETFVRTLYAFFNVNKYPPSLDFLLITLGPALLLLLTLEHWSGNTWPKGAPLRRVAVTFGRVPLFFYLLHLPLCHALAWGVSALAGRDTAWLFGAFTTPEHVPSAAPGRGFGLGVIYATWAAALLLLYPACRWFAALKQRRREAWLSYF